MDKIICYDTETDSVFAPYANLKMIGYQIGLDSEPQILDFADYGEVERFKSCLADPSWTKVHYNGINYDEIVLGRHGFPTNVENRHDVFLMAKTICPLLPAYGLKFVNWYYFGDPHEPERRLHAWLKHRGIKGMYHAPADLLGDYCKWDVVQTVRLFKFFWPIVQTPRHWRAYANLELPMGEVLHEIMLEGGECVNLGQIKEEIKRLEHDLLTLNQKAYKLTGGTVTNLGSGFQVATQLTSREGIILELTKEGNFKLRKDDLLTMLDLDNPTNDESRLARLTYEYRDTQKQLGYINAFRKAALFELRRLDTRRDYRKRGSVKIPKSYSLSGANTRRILSSSRFGINFQNQNKSSKRIAIVPRGWLGVWIDSTQIENVVHIWKSHDDTRRRSYIADPEWSEYVWLCNRILGGERTRETLDKIQSPANPTWSLYKQYKTVKLALNFGMGVGKFSRTNRISEDSARPIFAEIHRACPAIKGLIRQIQNEIARNGYIQDPFGHIYSGDPQVAYKIVAYFIQGCGTGSVPKAMARAIWETLHEQVCGQGVLTTLTHDEIGFRISLGLSDELILSTLRKCLWCMEEKFSPLFDNIPLRAKLSVSITNAAEAEVVNHINLTPYQWDAIVLDYVHRGRNGRKDTVD